MTRESIYSLHLKEHREISLLEAREVRDRMSTVMVWRVPGRIFNNLTVPIVYAHQLISGNREGDEV
ncbi:hypothetical protein GF324_09875 [bacterium]|nr:hypothetical protein [bacterium]